MFGLFRPEFSGTYSPERIRPDFVGALAQRVRSGLFPGASERRNKYKVVNESEGELRFRSEGLLSAITVGCNDVQVLIDLSPDIPGDRPKIHYRATFFNWAAYGVALCGFIAICLITTASIFGGGYLGDYPAAKKVFWIMVVFWGFIWPWILVALQKRPAARFLERLFDEVNSSEK